MKILRGTIFGGIAFFLLGWLVWGILLMDFMTANSNDCANRADTDMIWWAMILANFVLGLLISLVLKWAGAKTAMDGIRVGAVFGVLMSSTMDLMMYSMTTLYNLTALIVDVVAYTIIMAIIGLIVVLTWGKEKSS